MHQLNEQQQQAAQFTNGIAVVVAVPGSGKTLTMTQRIGHLVASGVPPENILGLTFTRNAAQAMREKLGPVLMDKADKVHLSTIHSFCHYLLRSEGRTFSILSGKEQLIFLKRIVEKLKFKDISVGMALQEIRLAKNNCISVDEFHELAGNDTVLDKIALIFESYEEEKSKKLAMDFEDLLNETYVLLKNDPEIREKYHSMFLHLMIDEYQDTNPLQLELIKILVDKRNGNSSLWVCGDDWQAIYAFTGASVGNILHFNRIFPDSSQFILNVNYRSTPQILAACQNLIRHNTRKIEKELQTTNADGEQPVLIEAADEEQEALLVGNEISDLVSRHGYTYEQIAVLYRANFQSMTLEETFSRLNLPYQIQNGMNFYDRREVAWLVDYLKLISDPDSIPGNESLKRIINIPNRYISKKFVAELEDFAASKGAFYYQALKQMPIETAFTKRNIREWMHFMDQLMEHRDDLGPAEAIHTIRHALDYDRFITDDDVPSPDDQKIQNVNQLHIAAARFETIQEFLAHIDTFQDSVGTDTTEGVQLMTIHKAKGLEFPVVFIVGMVENIMPTKKGDIEEERRICFVGISRAMQRLYLCCPAEYLGQSAKRSQFIDEILNLENCEKTT